MLAAAIAAIPVTQQTAQARLTANRVEQQRINTLPNDDDKQKARDGAQSGGQSGDLRDDQAAPDAGARIAVAAARADDVVLDEPLQRLLRQGQRPLDAGGVRRAGGARARARPVQRSGHGHRDLAGDARVSRQRAERRRQDQRELRARADGAAHARRERRAERLDATRRRTCRNWRACSPASGLNLTDNTPKLPAESAGALRAARPLRVQSRRATTSAPKTVLGHADRRAAASPKSRTPSRCSAGSRPPRASSARSSRRISSPTNRRPRSSSA